MNAYIKVYDGCGFFARVGGEKAKSNGLRLESAGLDRKFGNRLALIFQNFVVEFDELGGGIRFFGDPLRLELCDSSPIGPNKRTCGFDFSTLSEALSSSSMI